MIFNAGEKHYRTNNWTRIKVRASYTIDRDQKREWCKAQESNKSFYYHYASSHWWFEDEQDA